MAKRNLTNPDATSDWSVSQQQQTAIDFIVSGKNLQETADTIGVQRPTVSHWVNHHCGFQAALNSRRQEAFDSMVETLRGLLPKALAVLAKALEGETPLPAALAILKSCGLASANLRPTGPRQPRPPSRCSASGPSSRRARPSPRTMCSTPSAPGSSSG